MTLLGVVGGFFLGTAFSRMPVLVALIAKCYDREGFNLAGLPLNVYPVRVRSHLPAVSTYFNNPLTLSSLGQVLKSGVK